MAAVTAAVVGTVGSLAATGMSMAAQRSASSGGGGEQPRFGQAPEDPQDRAMRDYYARTLVANADKTYPAFNEYLQSGGDPEKAKFDLDMPAMKPSEAAALGFTGPRGETVPGISHETVAAGGGALTPEQTLYLAQERRREAASRGQAAGPWATKVGKMGGRIGRLEERLEKFTPTPEVEPREARLTGKLEKLRGKRDELLTPK